MQLVLPQLHGRPWGWENGTPATILKANFIGKMDECGDSPADLGVVLGVGTCSYTIFRQPQSMQVFFFSDMGLTWIPRAGRLGSWIHRGWSLWSPWVSVEAFYDVKCDPGFHCVSKATWRTWRILEISDVFDVFSG